MTLIPPPPPGTPQPPARVFRDLTPNLDVFRLLVSGEVDDVTEAETA